MTFASAFGLTAAALALEAIFGYPAFLSRAIGHPIMWIGALIGATESRFNRRLQTRKSKTLRSCALAFWLNSFGIASSPSSG